MMMGLVHKKIILKHKPQYAATRPYVTVDWAVLPLRILEIQGSNLAQRHIEFLRGFPQYLQGNCEILPQIRPPTLPPGTFQLTK